jgi:cell division septal protein FtsQ
MPFARRLASIRCAGDRFMLEQDPTKKGKVRMLFWKKNIDRPTVNKRRKATQRSPIYTVYARASTRRSEWMHRTGAIALAVMALSGVAWIAVQGAGHLNQMLFSANERFVVRHVEVTSTGKLTEAHVMEYGGFHMGQNLFELDIEAIRQRLEDGPLVKSAEVQRRLPDSLVVRVNERIPIARISQGDARFFFAVDIEGHVLGLASAQLANQPLVHGFKDRGVTPGTVLSDGAAIDALRVIQECGVAPFNQSFAIASIDVKMPDYLEVLLQSGVKVLLPRNPSRTKLEELVVYLRETAGRKTFFDLTVDRNVPAT